MARAQLREAAMISGYHAHIYYDGETQPLADQLRSDIRANFDVSIGRWRNREVGPHPASMYLVGFGPGLFADFVPWLALNRRGLDILVHPETGDDLVDHTDFALWLGQTRKIKEESFKRD
jgi:aromatic ring-cleaving dioxygenase